MMAKSLFTTITPLPAGVTRDIVRETLHDSLAMIDLNPAHTDRHKVNPPPEASAEEYHCKWYLITDRISYLPGVKGKVSFKACFHDLDNGMQCHVYAPMGLDIKEKWTIGGNMPGEPIMPTEIGIGAPVAGLYLREDVEIKCNFMMTRFVKGQLKDALEKLVARLVVKAQLREADEQNRRLQYAPLSPPLSPPSSAGPNGGFEKYRPDRYSTQTVVSEMGGSEPSQPSPRFQQSQPSPRFQQSQPSPRFQQGGGPVYEMGS